MIRIVQNDILQAKENIIAHQVNTQNIKSEGLAKKVWKKWPEGYAAYIAYSQALTKGGYIDENYS
ncbi:hypothetical protein WGM54_18585 [Paenibacillus polymyxa]|uniref:hypothetical protein n=1 Tax=Paenibacillus polymyxa TaxID=1406 RepID=UPI00307EFC30